MARSSGAAHSPLPAGECFDYLSAYENVAAWDPGVVEATAASGAALGEGSSYQVVRSLLGLRVTLRHRVTTFEPPERMVVAAETSALRLSDALVVETTHRGCVVSLERTVTLLGPLRVLEPLMAPVGRRLTRRALVGLAAQLRQPVTPGEARR